MAPKIVTNFRRSLSFPNLPPTNVPKPKKILHVRSASLPCRTHPIISQLQDEIAELNSWSGSDSGSAWLCHGLTRLKSVHELLDDLLLIPQTRESLCGGGYTIVIENVLDDFLRFVDVYGIFQTLILRLREEFLSAHMALRRRDKSKVGTHFKNLNKIAMEIGKLIPNLLYIGKALKQSQSIGESFEEEAELIEVVNDVVKVTVLVSVSLFGGIADSFKRTASFSCLGRKTNNVVVEGGIQEFREINLEDLRKEDVKNSCDRMRRVEKCIVGIESCGAKAFRSLINTRVSLLNVLTQ